MSRGEVHGARWCHVVRFMELGDVTWWGSLS